MLNEGGLLNGRIPSISARGRPDWIPHTPEGCGRPHARRGLRFRRLTYFPREVFFFGLGLPVAFCVSAACRFCFFVAIWSSRTYRLQQDSMLSGDARWLTLLWAFPLTQS
jgi:hypothetical protein